MISMHPKVEIKKALVFLSAYSLPSIGLPLFKIPISDNRFDTELVHRRPLLACLVNHRKADRILDLLKKP